MNIELGMTLTLSGKTKKGKERVKQWGAEDWVVTRIEDSVLFSTEKGPWLFIDNGEDKASRWIHAKHDKDFSIISVQL